MRGWDPVFDAISITAGWRGGVRVVDCGQTGGALSQHRGGGLGRNE